MLKFLFSALLVIIPASLAMPMVVSHFRTEKVCSEFAQAQMNAILTNDPKSTKIADEASARCMAQAQANASIASIYLSLFK